MAPAAVLRPFLVAAAVISVLTFFSLNPTARIPPPLARIPARRSLIDRIPAEAGLFDYSAVFRGRFFPSVTALSLILVVHFSLLIRTAQDHFSAATTKLSSALNLTPSTAAATLLALGNGAPDVFSSLAALRSGQPRTGLGAILSGGAFVSAFVVGVVAVEAGPFVLDAGSFIRDAGFYGIGAMFLFWVYLSGEIYLWQAIGFVGFYVFFVGLVFYMDMGSANVETKKVGNGGEMKELLSNDIENGTAKVELEGGKGWGRVKGTLCQISGLWDVPISVILKLTIPQTSPADWNRYYASVNLIICPLALLYACNSFVPMDHAIVFLIPNTHVPLWFIVLLASSPLALLHFFVEKEPPKSEQLPVTLAAFVMSVFWISTAAGELLNCLGALGNILELPPAFLGLTVLAWGNSVGDLVADVAVAKAGQPAMAMAGCFAGPMFNMLVGMGTALVIQTYDIFPEAYVLRFNISIVTAFVFLLLSLMGSLLVITWHRFRVPRYWGFCLVGLYAIFMLITLAIAKFSS
ncbi:hypothetical protein MLD38_038426 [Melastoma candidum]|uniref:Uncharacterized protein n=1 Tax=Melastoma candidum TaxID=119954 RepID=A0ACB9KZJ6_9MYRT|nr:hypothetical protein MLD38_038426 [Melastoma candidum]